MMDRKSFLGGNRKEMTTVGQACKPIAFVQLHALLTSMQGHVRLMWCPESWKAASLNIFTNEEVNFFSRLQK